MAYKVVILGDAGVGKSNLHSRFIYGSYHDRMRATVGVDFGVKRFTFGNRQVVLHVWDTAGQERFQAMTTRTYVKHAHGVVIVYDVTNRQSFTNVLSWKRKVDACDTMRPHVTSLLVGNKADTSPGTRQVASEEGLQLADSHAMIFLESSAKCGTNVDQVFRLLVGEIDRQQMNFPEVVRKPCPLSCSWVTEGDTTVTLSGPADTHGLMGKRHRQECCF